MHEKVALEHGSKSTKYELVGSYGDLVHEHFSVAVAVAVAAAVAKLTKLW